MIGINETALLTSTWYSVCFQYVDLKDFKPITHKCKHSIQSNSNIYKTALNLISRH